MISFNLQHEDTHNHPFFRLLLSQVLLPLLARLAMKNDY